MAITQQDIDTVNRLLAEYRQTAVNPWMTEEEYVARQLGDISRNRAQRLLVATRQGKTTKDLMKRR